MSEINQQDIPEPKYSEQELKDMRAKMTQFYKEELKHLQPQAQYYKLLADITESKYRMDAYKAKHSEFFVQQAQQEAEYTAQKEWYETELAAGRINEDGTPVEKSDAETNNVSPTDKEKETISKRNKI